MALLKHCLTSDILDGLGDSLSSLVLYEGALKDIYRINIRT
jgi:hypothetical protein